MKMTSKLVYGAKYEKMCLTCSPCWVFTLRKGRFTRGKDCSYPFLRVLLIAEDYWLLRVFADHVFDFWRIAILYNYELPLYGDQYIKINHVGHHWKGFSLLWYCTIMNCLCMVTSISNNWTTAFIWDQCWCNNVFNNEFLISLLCGTNIRLCNNY